MEAKTNEFGELPEHWRYLTAFKVDPCKNPSCEDEACWNYHSYKDKRRVPHLESDHRWSYTISTCVGKDCNYPDCRLAHNGLEVSFHPLIFKTRMCPSPVVNGKCTAHAHCSYAHSHSELRLPGEIFSRQDRRVVSINTVAQISQLTESMQNMQVGSSEAVTREALFKLYREQGALQTKLEKLEEQLKRKRQTVSCGACSSFERSLVQSACGHAFCFMCCKGRRDCPTCGKSGDWIALA